MCEYIFFFSLSLKILFAKFVLKPLSAVLQVPHHLYRPAVAFASWPLITYRYFGLSGKINNSPNEIKHSGENTANIICQEFSVPKVEERLATWPSKTPPVMPSWQSTPTAPLNLRGAVSVMYIGTKLVARPPENPEIQNR